jgi:ribosomal protein S18 acetylase RimI-like enzyme
MLSHSHAELTYVKRYRMHLDLLAPLPPVPSLPAGYEWLAWEESLLGIHAEVKSRCFEHEIDSLLFENLRDLPGCIRLMNDICRRSGFRPEATWLVTREGVGVGTVQGVLGLGGAGAIQNLGVVPEERGKGLGKALLLKSLHAFRDRGMMRATLEVTAQNKAAVQLYRQVGFRFYKTLYKIIDTSLASGAGIEDWYL